MGVFIAIRPFPWSVVPADDLAVLPGRGLCPESLAQRQLDQSRASRCILVTVDPSALFPSSPRDTRCGASTMRRRQRTGRARWVFPACLFHGPRTAPSGRRRLLEANETRTFGYDGEWRSLVAHLLWEQRVAGSNPVSPTNLRHRRQRPRVSPDDLPAPVRSVASRGPLSSPVPRRAGKPVPDGLQLAVMVIGGTRRWCRGPDDRSPR